MRAIGFFLLALALAGCAGTRATKEIAVSLEGPDICSVLLPDREAARAWTDARGLVRADPGTVLAALEAEGRDPGYRALLRRALGRWRWGTDWDLLLERAMTYDHREVGRLAVAGGADPNRRIVRRFVRSQSEEDGLMALVCDSLLEMDVRTGGDSAPLLLCAAPDARAQHFLLDAGADPNGWPVGDLSGGLISGIECALRLDDAELVRHYVACGADIVSHPVAGATASPEIAEWLVGQGATLRGDATHLSPLQDALMRGYTETARVLARHEPPDQPLPYPRTLTALGLAACKYSPLVGDLLDAGCDPYYSPEQAFAVAQALARSGDGERFRRCGFSPDLCRPWDPELEMPEGAAPESLLCAALKDLRFVSEEKAAGALRGAFFLLGLGADTQIPVFTGRSSFEEGREIPENLPLAVWFAGRYGGFCAEGAPGLRELYRRITGREPPAAGGEGENGRVP